MLWGSVGRHVSASYIVLFWRFLVVIDGIFSGSRFAAVGIPGKYVLCRPYGAVSSICNTDFFEAVLGA